MNSPSKSIKILNSSAGSALPVVLFFSVIGMLTVFTFFLHQLSNAKPSFNSSRQLQAVLTARSGIYKAFEIFQHKGQLFSDTLKTISTLDSLFGRELIEIKDPESELSETPVAIDLFPDEKYGTCEVALIPHGCFFMLESWATVLNAKSHITAKLGGRIPALPDTVLIYYNDAPWEGPRPDGKTVSFKTPPADTSNSLISKMIAAFQSQLLYEDSILYDQPIAVQSSFDIDKIKDTV
ncbi:MAG: hypothetical protein GX640_02500, partial [Fibrobacter sp.]|nr:hypothetical protein [Fibrobacter sp.]